MKSNITVGETNYGFTDNDLNNMTLAELEMFINNMIDTSMSYKDTNGTKYNESDKVSGFNKITSNSMDNSTYNYIYDKYFGPNSRVTYCELEKDFWGNSFEWSLRYKDGIIEEHVMPSAYTIMTIHKLKVYINAYFNDISDLTVSGTRGYRWQTYGGQGFAHWEEYNGYEYPARWDSYWASNWDFRYTLYHNGPYWTFDRDYSSIGGDRNGKEYWNRVYGSDDNGSSVANFRSKLQNNVAKIDKLSIINYKNNTPWNVDLYPIAESAIAPEYNDWLYEWAKSLYLVIVEKHSFMGTLKKELSTTFEPLKNKAIQIASSINGNESFGRKIQKLHNIITQEHNNAVVKAKALERLLGNRI